MNKKSFLLLVLLLSLILIPLTLAQQCGNSIKEGIEQCDDGNLIQGDGCNSVCITENKESVFDNPKPGLEYTGETPEIAMDGIGAFRIKCEYSHSLYDDPIVFPNQHDRSHLHDFYGNQLVDADTTAVSLFTTGTTTCHGGGTFNRASYWVPAMLVPLYDNSKKLIKNSKGDLTYKRVDAANGVFSPDFYYKAGIDDQKAVKPMPTGLRMISGDAKVTSSQGVEGPVRFSCESWQITSHLDFKQSIPDCDRGDNLRLSVTFPSCWDGVNLDVPDHKSHMAYPGAFNWPTPGIVCPDTHPVPVPTVSYNFAYPVTELTACPDGTSSCWRLASDMYDTTNKRGGYSAHGDWFMAWNQEIMDTFVKNCINKRLDCSDGNLGNGWKLSGIPKGTEKEPSIIKPFLDKGEHAAMPNNQVSNVVVEDDVVNTSENQEQIDNSESEPGFFKKIANWFSNLF